MLSHKVKRTLLRAGLDVHRISVSKTPELQLCKTLEHAGVDLVFDIGANVGQFAQGLHTVGYKGRIVSFEPGAEAHEVLLAAASRDDLWRVHARGAVGDYDGETVLNVAANSVSSSLLPMLNAHRAAAMESTYVGTEKVPLYRIDTVAPQYLTPEHRCFLKIDAQGYEWQVLDGAAETLKRAQGVLCEMALVPLYRGQCLWRELVDRLEDEGMILWAVQPGFTDPRTGRSLQLNAVFLREEIASADTDA